MSMKIKMGVAVLGLSAFAGAFAETNETVSAVAAEKKPDLVVTSAGVSERSLPMLTGLFGVKLGEKLPPEKGTLTEENVVAERFALPTKQPFLGFTDFVKLATPQTRQVFLVRASRAVMPGEAEKVMARAIRMIEFRFDVKAVAKDDNSKAVFFDGGDFILVSCRQDRVFVEAYRDKLLATAREEIATARQCADRVRFEKDLAALKMELTIESAGETSRPTGIASVLGRKFGDALTDGEPPKSLPDGSWYVETQDDTAFVGSSHFTIFGSTRTKSVYRIRILWSDCTDAEKYNQIRRTVELAMKAPMTESGKNYCRVELGNAFVTLYRDTTKNSIALDFSDKVIYARHLEESKNLPNDDSWRDIEVL